MFLVNFDINLILVPLALLFTLVWAYDYFVAKKYTYLPRLERSKKHTAKSLKSAQNTLKKALQRHALSLTESELSAHAQSGNLPDDVMTAYAEIQKNRTILAQEANAPMLVRWSYDTWWLLLLIVFGRAFIIEPFGIPSSSMVPTLYTGDFIVVNKFAYGLRLPITHTKILPLSQPQNGDVVVFRYPQNPNINYIKRVIGVSGDTVAMQNGELFVNGKALGVNPSDYTMPNALYGGLYPSQINGQTLSINERGDLGSKEETQARYHEEMLGNHRYIARTLGVDASQYAPFLQSVSPSVVMSGGRDWQVVVPEGQYFMMGDNRDRSEDSRFWGFVPEKNLAGKATYIWMHKEAGLHLPSFGRIGSIN